jgi:predicted amidohydrolase
VALIAVGQMTSTNDVEKNFATCAGLVEQAAARGVALLSLPETFAFLGNNSDESLAFMRPLEDELVTRYRGLAKQHGLWLSLGGFQERGPDDSHAYNAHLLVDDQGELVRVYRKLHLFDIDLPDGTQLFESRSYAAGGELVVTASPVGELGMTICYDLRFPEQFLSLRQMGAEVMLVPAAFTATTGKAHWETLLRARAIETQCWVAAAAQVGQHNPKRKSHGHAMIIDPWGCVVAQCDGERTMIAVADVDLDFLARVRQRLPCEQHRRPDVYGTVGEP